jgi:hypothetical protein
VTQFRRERLVSFTMIAAVFVIILAPELGYVPMWDGYVYARCAIDAAASGLTMESLRCAEHPSQGYALLLALSQLVRPGSIMLMHLTNVALGVLALGCFRLVLARAFPARAHARQLDLLTLACAVHPVLLSTLLQVNLDFGVYAFFFASVAAVMYRKFGWAAVAGTFLCFSKETGALAFGLMTGLFAASEIIGDSGTMRARLRRLVPSLAILAIPLALFAGHLAWWKAVQGQSAVWKQGWQAGTADGFNFFDFSEPIFLSYAAGIFLLGFGWVLTAVVGADLAVAGVRMARRQPDRDVPGADRRALAFLTVLTLLLGYVLTSYRTWSNLRYFALLYPLLVLLAFAALLRLGIPERMRGAVVGVIVGLFLLASYRSVDPVSRAIYGTFTIGDRNMYRMASITGEYGGPGRDELVYNLEFTGYHHVQNRLFSVIKPTAQTVIAASQSVSWNIWSPLDPGSFRRTMAGEHVILPRYADEADVAAEATSIPELWFLEFSNHLDTGAPMRPLGRLYREDRIVTVHARGHALRAHHLVRRELSLVP